MSLFVVDIESDGGLLGDNSMVCFGVVKLTDNLKTTPTFYGKTLLKMKEIGLKINTK